jgi:hypothetical protein
MPNSINFKMVIAMVNSFFEVLFFIAINPVRD